MAHFDPQGRVAYRVHFEPEYGYGGDSDCEEHERHCDAVDEKVERVFFVAARVQKPSEMVEINFFCLARIIELNVLPHVYHRRGELDN